MSKKSILHGTIIISVAGLIARFIGLFFRIPLTSLIGEEGVGIYSFPMTLFVPMAALVMQGPPTAIAKLISEKKAVNDQQGINEIFNTSQNLLLIIGVMASSLMIVLAPIFSRYIWSSEVLYPYLALALAPIILSRIAVLNGYYQGVQIMSAIAFQQLSDGIGRLVIGLGLAYILIEYGTLQSTTGAVFGTTAGAFTGFLAVYIFFLNDKNRPRKIKVLKEKKISISKQLLKTSLPITIGAVGASLIILVDALLLKTRLTSFGLENADVYIMNGILSNVNALINVPLIIGVAISLNIVPNISAARVMANNTVKTRMRSSLILSLSLALPCGIGLLLIGKDVFHLFYPTMSTNHYLIEILSINTIFVMVNQALIAILQGMDYEKLPVKNFYRGMLIKVILSYILLGIPVINIHGAAISTLIAYLFITASNYYACKKNIGFVIDKKYMVVLPLMNIFIMGMCVYTTRYLLIDRVSLLMTILLTILVGIVIYGILLLVTKIVSINNIPLLNRLVSNKK